MKLIELPFQIELSEVEKTVLSEFSFLNSSLNRRVQEHKMRFEAFWKNYSIPPDTILKTMGSKASIWLAAAAESVNHINNLASIVGKEIGDFLPPEMYIPPRKFIINEDYSVSLEPPQPGFDAWGREIPGFLNEQEASDPIGSEENVEENVEDQTAINEPFVNDTQTQTEESNLSRRST